MRYRRSFSALVVLVVLVAGCATGTAPMRPADLTKLGVADAAQRSAYLSAGISEALHTTAFGLIIAIPTLMIQGRRDFLFDIDHRFSRLTA